MEPYIGVIFYILFFFWEVYLIGKYLKLIGTKIYRPKITEEKKEIKLEYSPEEIAHMMSIEQGNYFSDSMAKVDSCALLELFRKGHLKTNLSEQKNKAQTLEIAKGKPLSNEAEKEIWKLFKNAQEKNGKKKDFSLRQMKWKVFGYSATRQTNQSINKKLKENLKNKELLNKNAFETIEKITRETFVNFVLLFLVYGFTYMSFIPNQIGMVLAVLFTICNMVLGFVAKKRISRYTKKGVNELEKCRLFGEGLVESLQDAQDEKTKLELVENYYTYGYALGQEENLLQEIKNIEISKEKYPFTYLLKQTNFLKEIKDVERTNAFKLKKIY